MATLTFLDTHAVVWLYSGRLDLFPDSVLARIEIDELVISPMVVLEMTYLCEIGRIEVAGPEIAATLAAEVDIRIATDPFEAVIAASIRESWTKDPFDRLIVASAMAAHGTLMTKDQTIRDHCEIAFWSE